MNKAKYWDHAWNPVVGCLKASEGCEHCYAERMTKKFGINGGNFTPQLMLAVKTPPMSGVVFAGNMTDLFGEWNSREQIRHWLAQLSRSAVNLVLTKRAERMNKVVYPGAELPHIWWGVTAENQERADERIRHLLSIRHLQSTPESITINRWLSLEPLLGTIDLVKYLCDHKACNDWAPGTCDNETCPSRKIDWVVVGAESGKDGERRECKIEWVESIVDQCRAAGVPVFVKQLHIGGKMVNDINKFPKHLQIREMPWEGK